MGRAANQILTLGMVVVAVVVFVYAMKNPNVKSMITGILNQLKGIGSGTGGQQQQQQQPSGGGQQQQSATPPTFTSRFQGIISPPGDFTGRSTGPGTRSQDPITQAINRCVGVGVSPPDPQAYNKCVNAAAKRARRVKARRARMIRIGLA